MWISRGVGSRYSDVVSPGKTILCAALSLVAAACEATEGCAESVDCEEGLACVFLAADAERGACVEVQEGEFLPRTPLLHELHPDVSIDVLIVVDDSLAMAGRQAALAASMDGLLAELQTLRNSHVRIGVTTTEVDHPLCPGTPVDGALLLRSCREHLVHFVDDAAGIDVSSACTDACALETLPVEPSRIIADDEPRERPWLDSFFGGSATNLEEDADLAEALRCGVLQGIAGCRYSSPLAAVKRALERSKDRDDPMYGFRRDDASFAVIVISVGNDCSVAPDHSDIFLDNPVFWDGQAQPDLSPGVCWRAGVVCEGPGPVYAGCGPADLGADGEPASPEDAVLISVSSVIDAVNASLHPGTGAAVLAIGGVPTDADLPIPYAEAEDPEFQAEHGIGPGCAGGMVSAPPPVRLNAFAAEFPVDERAPWASVCADDLTRIAEFGADMRAFSQAGCVGACDADPTTPGHDVMCEVIVNSSSGIRYRTVPACVREGDAWVSPLGSPRCYVVHTGEELPRQCGYLEAAIEIVTVEPDPAYTLYDYGCTTCPDKSSE